MKFIKIDKKTWNRIDSYNYYLNDIPCTYSMTVELEITDYLKYIKDKELKFFPSILYAITHIVNKHEEFRMDIDEEKNIGFYNYINPCYTVFHEETQTITNVWTEYSDDFEVFMKNYNVDMQSYKKNYEKSKAIVNRNIFNISVIPWVSFKGFNLNLQKGYDYLLPIFTVGKYFEESDKILIPISIQVHHAVCDGFHLSRFINELQGYFNKFKK